MSSVPGSDGPARPCDQPHLAAMNTAHEFVLPARPPTGGPTMLDMQVTLPEATNRIAIRVPSGTLGRAEALLGERSWAAKHYWTQGDELTIFEFDEPLPAGRVSLRVLHTPA